MKHFLRSKKGVSPVVATVLIIAIVVAAGAVVWTIVQNVDEQNIPNFAYSVDSSFDYNNDGMIDTIRLVVTNVDSDAGKASYVSEPNWEIVPGFDVDIFPQTDQAILVSTSDEGSQFAPNSDITIGVGPFDDRFKLAEVTVGTGLVPNPTTVIVNSGSNPVSGAIVTFLNDEGLPPSIPPIVTDTNGRAQAYMMPDLYTARTTSGLSSEEFHNVLTQEVVIGTVAEIVHVRVVDDTGVPVSGITVYDTDSQQNDLGQSAVTDSNGDVMFTEPEGRYLFRAEYLGSSYFSSETTVPGAVNLTIQLTTNAELVGLLEFGEGNPAGQNLRVRLYTVNNASMGRSDRTNATSHFEFRSGVAAGLYRIRLDYQGNRYWSGALSTSDPNLVVNLGGGDLNVLVTAGGEPLPNNVQTRLYHSNNASAGRSDRLNSSGMAEYPNTPGGQYRLRIDWLNQRIFSVAFTHSSSDLRTLDLGGGLLNIQVTAGGDPLPNNVLTRLYSESNVSASRNDRLNSTGWAEYGSIPAGSYRLRVDWLNQRFWTVAFDHDGTSRVLDLAGGSLNIQVTAGGAPLPSGVLTRLYSENNVSASRNDRLNGTGWAEYGPIPDGMYRLRVDWLNQRFWTTTFASDGSDPVVDIGGGALNVQVLASGDPLPNNVLTRLYSEDNVSASRNDRLNSTGWAEYGAIPDGMYRLRIDWLNQRFWTPAFPSDGSPQVVDIGGGSLNIEVLANGAPLPNNVLTRLYSENNVSASRNDRLNATGWAEYGPIPEGMYRLRIDWLNERYWTTAFPSDGTPQSVDVGGGLLNIEVTVDGVPLPTNVLTRLYHADNTSASRNDRVDASGIANYGAIPAGDFRLRIDWMNERYYTISFTHDGQASYTLDLPGVGSMEIAVTDMGVPLGNNIRVRLYHSDGTNTGRSLRTNSTGHVVFSAVPAGDYMLQMSGRFSDQFTAMDTQTVNFSNPLLPPGFNMQTNVISEPTNKGIIPAYYLNSIRQFQEVRL